jgi:CRISPR/Cas system-associated exonuclease Cas4 (RecB family)
VKWKEEGSIQKNVARERNNKKKVKQTINDCKQLAQESKQQLELALVELEQIKKEGAEKAKLSEDQLMEKDKHITALKGKVDVLKGNDLLVSALKSELEIKSNAYSKLAQALGDISC